MDLFEEITNNDIDSSPKIITTNNNSHPQITYEKLVNEVCSEQKMSSLTQYLLAPFLLVDSNGILDIPIFDKTSESKVLKEIAPHFNKVEKITIDSQILIRVQKVREESKAQFLDLNKSNKINAIVKDIYADGNVDWEESFSIKEYKVNLEAISKTTGNDILSMWDFFEQSFVRANGDFVILPNGWDFDESFKNRITVQSFASVCKSMMVTVNQNSNKITSVFVN